MYVYVRKCIVQNQIKNNANIHSEKKKQNAWLQPLN